MHAIFRSACPAIAAVILSACCSTSSLTPKPPGAVHVDEVVKAVQNAIDPFWQGSPNGLPPIASVKLALQTVHDNRISGEADYLIVALKGYYDNAFTQEMDLVLVPQQKFAALDLVNGPSLEKALHDAIESAQGQIKKSYGSGPHALSTQEVDVQISFAVTWDVSAGVAKWIVAPVSISASDEWSSKTTNTVTVTFKAPEPKASP